VASVWEKYDRYREALGHSKRDKQLLSLIKTERRRMVDSLSCRQVKINGVDQTVMITHTAEMDEKKIFSLPGEHLEHGGIVDFANNKWLIVEMDPDNLVYDKAIMRQCNHILRWIGKDGTLKEKWCVAEDGTKLGLPNSPCLAYWKRYARTTPLIAGTPLEPLGDWAISSEALINVKERSTTIPVAGVRPSGRKWGALTRVMRYGEDIVCAPRKLGGRFCVRREVAFAPKHNGSNWRAHQRIPHDRRRPNCRYCWQR